MMRKLVLMTAMICLAALFGGCSSGPEQAQLNLVVAKNILIVEGQEPKQYELETFADIEQVLRKIDAPLWASVNVTVDSGLSPEDEQAISEALTAYGYRIVEITKAPAATP